jgi:hypothetical protein
MGISVSEDFITSILLYPEYGSTKTYTCCCENLKSYTNCYDSLVFSVWCVLVALQILCHLL